LKAERASVEAEKTEARARTEADKKKLAEMQAERVKAAAKVNPQVLRKYEHQRKKWGATTVVEAVDGRCTGCQIGLRPQFLQDLRKGDQIMTCETCGRILFYNPPISVEPEVAEPHSA